MDLGRILGGFWRALGGPGGPNGDQNGGNSWTFRHPVPGWLQGQGLGRIWEGFRDFGRVLEGFREDFK